MLTAGRLTAGERSIDVLLVDPHAITRVGMIAALVNVQTGDITVVDARNVLRNADIDVLNNALNNLNVEILNNSEILSDIEISNILNDLNVNVEDVVVVVNALGGTVIFLP